MHRWTAEWVWFNIRIDKIMRWSGTFEKEMEKLIGRDVYSCIKCISFLILSSQFSKCTLFPWHKIPFTMSVKNAVFPVHFNKVSPSPVLNVHAVCLISTCLVNLDWFKHKQLNEWTPLPVNDIDEHIMYYRERKTSKQALQSSGLGMFSLASNVWSEVLGFCWECSTVFGLVGSDRVLLQWVHRSSGDAGWCLRRLPVKAPDG